MRLRNLIAILLCAMLIVSFDVCAEAIDSLPFEPSISVTVSNGDTWYSFGSNGGGVVRESDGVLEQFTTENSGIALNMVKGIVEDTFGNIWFILGEFVGIDEGDNYACSMLNSDGWHSYFLWHMIGSWRLDDAGQLWIHCLLPFHGWAQIESYFDGERWNNFPYLILSGDISFTRRFVNGKWVFEGLDTENITGGYEYSHPLSDNFPLTVGSTWTYKRSLEYYKEDSIITYSDTISVMVVGTTELDGYTWALMLDGSAYRQDEKGDVYIYGSSYEPFFDFRPCEGDDCNPLYFQVGGGTYFVRYNTHVDVPAGSFDGWRFSKGDMNEWSSNTIAPGIGRIAYSYDTDYLPPYTWELVSYDIVDYPVHVKEQTDAPVALEIINVSPNPFNPSSTISYTLPQNSHVTLSVYNTAGQRVAVLKDEYQQAGRYSAAWNATGFSSGLYFAVIEAGGFSDTRKMMLVK